MRNCRDFNSINCREEGDKKFEFLGDLLLVDSPYYTLPGNFNLSFVNLSYVKDACNICNGAMFSMPINLIKFKQPKNIFWYLEEAIKMYLVVVLNRVKFITH